MSEEFGKRTSWVAERATQHQALQIHRIVKFPEGRAHTR
jgi:hypothetical protein